ncbi:MULTISPECIES: SIS domain-containing protein [unclassified Gilliamella]|uniref:SIS domain-containing protein n=1 Tax=unclassified Gilliamella TaxID=2685620 RepID=UPI001C69993C|nr:MULTISPECIES: SIS domain-containing protein [unclassified Gilliamella]MCX8601678.1 SIS domain-containing protein [Gilliamella sp. B3722]MCX8608600.1 SIS domain-containing protein [Gilliamella sp. B3771]MCX8610941.1 SIS domain-containing protein [Gilliamella sp. B3891]MCX8613409.1 SIS domain-containing protein [Gilliamella sp. B3773]MCX8615252.1 SIS domain-containing protein [Gilliamella sp. B3770]
MRKYDEKKELESMNGALALRPQINEFIDKIHSRGYSNVCWLGIGGTYASSMQAVVHMKEKSAIETFIQHAAEYLVTGNKRITKDTLIIISSVTGSTQEVVAAIDKIQQEVGATVLAFLDKADSPLGKMAHHVISYPMNEQLKFFMAADRLMYLAGEYPDYDEFYQQMDQHFAKNIVEVAKKADAFGQEVALKHHNDAMHYFVGAGNQWGATYSHAMCYWEEQHWLRSKSIESAEFFHGTLEVIDRDTAVTVYVGEDSQRPLSERVAKFLPQICGNYTIIDTKDYPLPGISEKYRGHLSPFVFRTINNRIDAYVEHLNRHPMTIRRYYRCLDY